jgi:hypothetical protein
MWITARGWRDCGGRLATLHLERGLTAILLRDARTADDAAEHTHRHDETHLRHREPPPVAEALYSSA